jgi:hypothetical protein
LSPAHCSIAPQRAIDQHGAEQAEDRAGGAERIELAPDRRAQRSADARQYVDAEGTQAPEALLHRRHELVEAEHVDGDMRDIRVQEAGIDQRPEVPDHQGRPSAIAERDLNIVGRRPQIAGQGMEIEAAHHQAEEDAQQIIEDAGRDQRIAERHRAEQGAAPER